MIYGPRSIELNPGADGKPRVVTLRHCTSQDAALAPEYFDAIASESKFTYLYPGQKRDVAQIASNWEGALASPSDLIAGAFDASRLVGYLGLRALMPEHPWGKHVAFFWTSVLREYWGSGLAGALLKVLDEQARAMEITRIEAVVNVANERGIALYKKHGYEIEGTRRRAVFVDGEYADNYYISKLL